MKELVTRNDLREMGLDVSNTSFNRYEKEGLLTPVKAGGHRSARVRYRWEEAKALIEPPKK
jgi:transposase